MWSETILTVLLLTGALLFVFFYHVRTRKIDTQHRQRVRTVPHYEFVDWYLKVSSLAITLAAIFWTHPLLLQFHDSTSVRWLGMGLAACSMLLFSWAMTTLDVQYSPAHRAHLPDALVSTGPYRWIRHPIYMSNLILLIALTLVSGSAWLIVNLFVLFGYYLPTIRREEQAIAASWDEYRDYMKRTGRFFPRVGRSE